MLSYLPSAAAAVIGLSSFALGHSLGYATLGAGVALGCFCIIGFWSHVTSPTPLSDSASPTATATAPTPKRAQRRRRVGGSGLGSSPVETLLREHRSAIVLRKSFVDELNEQQLVAARREFTEQMAFIHAGRVRLDSWVRVAEQDERGKSILAEVEPFWMDRTAVTNEQFLAFIRADGYNPEAPWWPDEARPLILQFQDQTGQPGPAGWSRGHFAKGSGDHPVVGVSWYEAVAYATWAGKQLPTDADWLKAATWPIDASGAIMQRVYPWGNQLHSRHARLWNEEGGEIVSVDDFLDGTNPCGIQQLIGNVWEWMHGTFGEWDDEMPFPIDTMLATIRGGAFDTYFQSQATAQFFSAEPRANRRRNIGFRCVVDASKIDIPMKHHTSTVSSSDSRDSIDAAKGGSDE